MMIFFFLIFCLHLRNINLLSRIYSSLRFELELESDDSRERVRSKTTDRQVSVGMNECNF